MTDLVCPNCGQVGVYTPPGPCEICGFSLSRTLLLLKEDGSKAREMNTAKKFDMHWARPVFGDESKYWDRRHQYTIQPDGSNWILTPNPSSQNHTLVNGVAIADSCVLQQDDRISVGNADGTVLKTTLLVIFE